MTPLEFCLYLQNLATPDFNSFNMYANTPMFEKEAVIARKNLLRYLSEMSKRKPSVLLVGEAPGKDGCAISGIPFTSEYQLLNEPFFSSSSYSTLNQGKPVKERIATAFWNILKESNRLPLLWNIYPFHPFDPKTRKNRCPNTAEIEVGKEVLEKLLSIFDIIKIYAVGRTAENALKGHPLFGGYIRHPSYGGIKECREKLLNILS